MKKTYQEIIINNKKESLIHGEVFVHTGLVFCQFASFF